MTHNCLPAVWKYRTKTPSALIHEGLIHIALLSLEASHIISDSVAQWFSDCGPGLSGGDTEPLKGGRGDGSSCRMSLLRSGQTNKSSLVKPLRSGPGDLYL